LNANRQVEKEEAAADKEDASQKISRGRRPKTSLQNQMRLQMRFKWDRSTRSGVALIPFFKFKISCSWNGRGQTLKGSSSFWSKIRSSSKHIYAEDIDR